MPGQTNKSDIVSYPIGTAFNPFLKEWNSYAFRYRYDSGVTHDFMLACQPILGANPFLRLDLYEHFALIECKDPFYVRTTIESLSHYKNPSFVECILPEIKYDTRDISCLYLRKPAEARPAVFLPLSGEKIATPLIPPTVMAVPEAMPDNPPTSEQSVSDDTSPDTLTPRSLSPKVEIDSQQDGQASSESSIDSDSDSNAIEIVNPSIEKQQPRTQSYAQVASTPTPAGTKEQNHPPSVIDPSFPTNSTPMAKSTTSWAARVRASTRPVASLPKSVAYENTHPKPEAVQRQDTQANRDNVPRRVNASTSTKHIAKPKEKPQPVADPAVYPTPVAQNATISTPITNKPKWVDLFSNKAILPQQQTSVTTETVVMSQQSSGTIESDAVSAPSHSSDNEAEVTNPTSTKIRKKRQKKTNRQPVTAQSNKVEVQLEDIDHLIAEQSSKETTYEKVSKMIERQDITIFKFLPNNLKTLTPENIVDLHTKCTGLPDQYRAKIVAILSKEKESRKSQATPRVKKSRNRLSNMTENEINVIMAKREQTFSLLMRHCLDTSDWSHAYIAAIEQRRLDLIDDIRRNLSNDIPTVDEEGIHILILIALITDDAAYVKELHEKLMTFDKICQNGLYQSNFLGDIKHHSFLTDYLYLTDEINVELLQFLCSIAKNLNSGFIYPKVPNLYCNQQQSVKADGRIEILVRELSLAPMEIAVQRGFAKAIEVLHKGNVSITTTPHGPSLACMAITNNQLESLKALRSCGAELTTTIGKNCTLLDLAFFKALNPEEEGNFLPIIEYLIYNTDVGTKISSQELMTATKNLKKINSEESDVTTRLAAVMKEAIRRTTSPSIRMLFNKPEPISEYPGPYTLQVANSREQDSDSKYR